MAGDILRFLYVGASKTLREDSFQQICWMDGFGFEEIVWSAVWYVLVLAILCRLVPMVELSFFGLADVGMTRDWSFGASYSGKGRFVVVVVARTKARVENQKVFTSVNEFPEWRGVSSCRR